MKIYKRTMQVLIIAALILTAFLGGIYRSEYKQRQKASQCTVTTIAVVNADAGIVIDGKTVNYGEELMTFPDVNFVMAGLEDAREGLDVNRYAAYILVPSTFSQSVNSINSKPQKAQIVYEINLNLREDIQEKVSDDIYNFLVNLNTNISYVYVDAILQEVHSVQDDSSTILTNDMSDMEAVRAIDSEALLEDLEYSELETGTVEIQYLDLWDDFTSLKNTSDSICSTYEMNIQAAQKEFLKITDSSNAIDTARNTADNTLTNVDILTNSEGNLVYEEGIRHLGEYTEQFIENTVKKKKDAKTALGWKDMDSPEESSSIEMLTGQIDEQIILLEALLQQGDSDNSGDTVSGNTTTDGGTGIPKKEIQQIIKNLKAFQTNLNAYYTKGITAIDAIPDASWVTDDMQTIINEEISQPILTECDEENQTVAAALNDLQGVIDNYAATIKEFDALSYIEQEKIAADIASIRQTVSAIQTDIIATDNSYIQYINELNLLTSQNVAALQNSLNVAYQLTQTNIDTAITGLKTNRENLNAQNVQMLGEIVQKLPYTRLGNLEYREAYDFIVQPIVKENQSDEKEILLYQDGSVSEGVLVSLMIGISVLIILYWSVLSIHSKIKRAEGKEGEV